MKRTVPAAVLAIMGAVAAAAAILTAPATGAAAQGAGMPQAQATVNDANGKTLGTVTLTQFPQGLLIHGELEGLPPGWHGLHIHENGTCSPTFAAAGGHFNPNGGQHGIDAAPIHAGDQPNIWVDDAGKTSFEFVSHQLTLGDGIASLAKSGGTSVVVHAREDDYASEPAGNSGDRIACGVIATH